MGPRACEKVGVEEELGTPEIPAAGKKGLSSPHPPSLLLLLGMHSHCGETPGTHRKPYGFSGPLAPVFLHLLAADAE